MAHTKLNRPLRLKEILHRVQTMIRDSERMSQSHRLLTMRERARGRAEALRTVQGLIERRMDYLENRDKSRVAEEKR